MSVEMPVAAGEAAPDDATSPKCPTDFRYWAGAVEPRTRRIRAACQTLFRFDPCPSDEHAEALIADLYGGDPVAERFVAEVYDGEIGPRKGRKMLDKALAEGIDAVPDAPDSMRELFTEFETVPDWVDRDTVERGAALWRRWGTTLFNVAGAGTLEMYTEAAVAIPLSLAGGYAGDNALRRFLETSRFWIDVSQPGGLFELGSDGRTTAMRVRVMHVAVRRRVAEHDEWDMERWGLPISQTYMMLTQMGGSVAPALAMWGLGYMTTPSEMRALLHFQKYMGYLLGVRARWYPEDIREGIQAVFATAIARTHTAGPPGAELIESFPKAFAPKTSKFGRRRLRELYAYHQMVGFVSFLVAPGTRRRYEVPPPLPGALLLLARVPFTLVAELARHFVPGAAEIIEKKAVKQRMAWYEMQMDGREAAFEAASGLRR
jgi:hypothetical protein